MQRTSAAYKKEQKEYLRNENYITVYLGVISQEAQANAVADGGFTVYSSPQDIFGNIQFEAYYCSSEENMARCDASQFFLPRDEEAFALYQGLVTQNVIGEVNFTFGSYHALNIKGLTIDFGDFYPTHFIISNGTSSYTYEYYNYAAGEWTTEDEFLGTETLTITVLEMVGGQQRLRIHSILFGLGFLFDNTNLISTSWKSEVAHISDSLPAKTFSFTIDNLSRKFSADNPHAFVSFLEEGQEVYFKYGRKLDDDSIYEIPGGKLSLNSWSSNDQQAKFTAVGNLDYSSSTYDKGQYYEDGISLYDLAVDVCEDAGYTNYKIDSYLKKVFTHNPLPIAKHKELLQLIANAALSIFRETREGSIEIRSSFQPDIVDIHSNGHLDYTVLQNVVDIDAAYSEYATAEQNFTYTDAHQYFIPRSQENYLDGAYVSSSVTDGDGIFSGSTHDFVHFLHENGVITGITFKGDITTQNGKFTGDGIEIDLNERSGGNPKITIEWEAIWSFYNMTLIFSDVIPTGITIHVYEYDDLRESFNVEDISFDTVVNYDFYDVTKLVIEFTSSNPYQRIHLGKILFGSQTNYTIEYRDMSVSPTAIRTDFIKNVNVVYSQFAYGTSEKTASTVSAVIGENKTTFKTAYHDYSLSYKEIKDDDEEHTKVSKVFVDSLPNVDDAKTSTRYFVPTGTSGQYYMYMIETNDGVKSWNLLSTVTESIVSALPGTLVDDVLYLVETDTALIYHLYMLYHDTEEDKTLSLGYDVRGTLEILESGAYYIVFTSNVAANVDIKATEFVIAESTYVNQLNEVGTDKTAENVLIDSVERAQEEAEWLGEYFSNDVQYTIQYRGEPALDPDDLIYIENKFVEKNLVRITDTQIDTSTGMSMTCKIGARRVSYLEVAKVDVALVNYSEVYDE